jgi:hypothetical protein
MPTRKKSIFFVGVNAPAQRCTNDNRKQGIPRRSVHFFATLISFDLVERVTKQQHDDDRIPTI